MEGIDFEIEILSPSDKMDAKGNIPKDNEIVISIKYLKQI